MVHKKYTYKDGKKFGPYYYETKRVDGKIITTYLGNAVPKNRKNILYVHAPVTIGYDRLLETTSSS